MLGLGLGLSLGLGLGFDLGSGLGLVLGVLVLVLVLGSWSWGLVLGSWSWSCIGLFVFFFQVLITSTAIFRCPMVFENLPLAPNSIGSLTTSAFRTVWRSFSSVNGSTSL